MSNLISRHTVHSPLRDCIIFVFFVASFVLSNPELGLSQNPAVRNRPAASHASEDPAIVRWKIVLQGLAQEARTVFPEERRPYAMVEVANAFWEVERDTSRQIYFSALDSALALNRLDKKYHGLVNYVLSSAARLDASLAKELNNRLLAADGDRRNISVETALDLIEENPVAAAQLAEAFAPAGMQDGTAAFLIFSLAKKDVRLADRVYSVYLNKASANENIDIESVVTLGGYAFGYSEFYSVNRRGELTGSSYPPIPGLTANSGFTNAFLNLASRRLALAIQRRNRAVGGEVEALNFSILFASDYLVPEVAQYSPSALSVWRELQQRGIVGASTEQTLQIQNHILQIRQARLRSQRFGDNSQTPELEAEASLENVEKMTGTCRRDVIYSKAALLFGARKNFKRALEIAGKIEDINQNEIVKEAIEMDIVEFAIGAGEFEKAESRIEKISSPVHKARLYVMLLNALITRAAGQQTQAVIDETIKLIEKLPDAGDRAAFQFSVSTILLKSDPQESQSLLRSAVRNLNKKEPADQPAFVIPIKVPLSCPGEEVTWYGGFETLPTSSVFDAVAAVAKENPDETSREAEEIGDKITRIRALALVSRVALIDLVRRTKRRPEANLSRKDQ